MDKSTRNGIIFLYDIFSENEFKIFNPGTPGKIDPLGLHFAHKNVQIDLLYKKFKT